MARKPEPLNRPTARPLADPAAWLKRTKDETRPMRNAFTQLAVTFDRERASLSRSSPMHMRHMRIVAQQLRDSP